MEIRQLRTLLAIAETGSLSKAAELLHIVQPALSRQLKQLEEELGVPLFERNRLGMVLTPPGRKFIDQVRLSLQGLYQAKADIGLSKTHLMGSVAIGMLPSLADDLAGNLVMSLRTQYPDLKIRIATGYTDVLQDALERGQLDIGIFGDYMQSELLHTSPIYHEPMFLVGLPNSKLCSNQAVNLEQAAQWPMVMPEAQSLRSVIDRACTIMGTPLHIVAESDRTSVLLDLVKAGLGYTILPVISILPLLNSGQLIGAPIKSPTLRRTITICSPVLTRNPHTVKALHLEVLDWLRPYAQRFNAIGVEWIEDNQV